MRPVLEASDSGTICWNIVHIALLQELDFLKIAHFPHLAKTGLSNSTIDSIGALDCGMGRCLRYEIHGCHAGSITNTGLQCQAF